MEKKGKSVFVDSGVKAKGALTKAQFEKIKGTAKKPTQKKKK